MTKSPITNIIPNSHVLPIPNIKEHHNATVIDSSCEIKCHGKECESSCALFRKNVERNKKYKLNGKKKASVKVGGSSKAQKRVRAVPSMTL